MRAFNAVNALALRRPTARSSRPTARGSSARPLGTRSDGAAVASGRLFVLDPGSNGHARELARGLDYAFGACALRRRCWSARAGVIGWSRVGRRHAAAGARAPAGLSLAACRRRPAAASGSPPSPRAPSSSSSCCARPPIRRRMMEEIEPEHWIAPRLRSGESYHGADAGRASAHHGRAEAVGAAALLWPGDPSLRRRPAALFAAQPGRRHQPRRRGGGRVRRRALSAGQGTGPPAATAPRRHREGVRAA